MDFKALQEAYERDEAAKAEAEPEGGARTQEQRTLLSIKISVKAKLDALYPQALADRYYGLLEMYLGVMKKSWADLDDDAHFADHLFRALRSQRPIQPMGDLAAEAAPAPAVAPAPMRF